MNVDGKKDLAEILAEEIKILRGVNESLHRRLNTVESLIYSKNVEIASLTSSIESYEKKLYLHETEKRVILKKHNNQIKKLESDVRKNDIFNKKCMSTSKTKKEAMMLQEMDSLRKVNTTLLGFVKVLSTKFDFDNDVVKDLVEIADSIEDRVIKLFLDSIAIGNELNEIKTSSIKAQDDLQHKSDK